MSEWPGVEEVEPAISEKAAMQIAQEEAYASQRLACSYR